ncbi:MAG: leucyl/phenylalanyl-tRNA--protein transferase [Nitriliruptoraceae bacterium]
MRRDVAFEGDRAGRAESMPADGTAVLRWARPPRALGRSPWAFPDPRSADEDGVVGVGADLHVATLVDAYRQGLFPWPHADLPLPWFCPDPRGVIPVDEMHVSRSLRRRLRTCGWTVTVDEAFAQVVEQCAAERDDGTWITTDMARAYAELHRFGWAHSIEVWDGSSLVGGVYGVQVGGVFTGESMFHRQSDASKVALIALASRFAVAGGEVIDVQLTTPHLATIGARDIDRDTFLRTLARLRDRNVRFALDPLPASTMAMLGRIGHTAR